MNNRNQQTNPVPAPVRQPLPGSAAAHFNVFSVEEYESKGKSGKRWTKVVK